MSRAELSRVPDEPGVAARHRLIIDRPVKARYPKCNFLKMEAEGTTVTGPVPNHSEIEIGTLLSIIRQSGLPRTEFEKKS